MSTSMEHQPQPQHMMMNDETTLLHEKLSKTTLLGDSTGSSLPHSQHQHQQQQHPLHQYDWTVISHFLDSCVGKFSETNDKFSPTEWAKVNPMPPHLTWEQKRDWPNPMMVSRKQHVLECFSRLARESGEPMILMPNFDYGDIINFERFLQALKVDGVNAIGKYKNYLNNKDMRKFEIDLVVMHARYGLLLVEVKECDHLDNKRRSRARIQLNNARSCFEQMARLVIEAKGWTSLEAQIPITEIIALPNAMERPASYVPPTSTMGPMPNPMLNQSHTSQHNQSLPHTSTSSTRSPRVLQYVVKSELDCSIEFAKWWTRTIVEPKSALIAQLELENRPNKFDLKCINWMTGLIHCIRNNSIMPVVYPESGSMFSSLEEPTPTPTPTPTTEGCDGVKPEDERVVVEHQQPALNLRGEFFQIEHELVRTLSKVVVCSRDAEKMRKTICLQILWLLLNDSQKKISVVCSENNKPFYEQFFARQRKLYNNLTNVRFYTDLQVCGNNGQPATLKKDGETWYFDSGLSAPISEVVAKCRDLNAFWIYTTHEDSLQQYKTELETMQVRVARLDHHEQQHMTEERKTMMPWLSGVSLKFPLKLSCDLLVIGDIVSSTQMKLLYRNLKTNSVVNHSSQYSASATAAAMASQQPIVHHHHNNNNHHNNNQQQQPQQQLQFNPTKKFKSIKFVRGGTIDNLRNSLKMHDSIQAPVVLLHVGDEDLFKTRNSQTTVDRIKELATLVKEYCPNSFIVISTLMRRMSKTENGVTNEVNKSIMAFCKQTRDSANFHYMLNNHFEPDFHTQEGRILNNKGLRLYVENVLFVIDYFMIKNQKQH